MVKENLDESKPILQQDPEKDGDRRKWYFTNDQWRAKGQTGDETGQK
jgi:hypothetical protein